MSNYSCSKEECCCHCKWLIELMKHPSNTIDSIARGSILETYGYACCTPEFQQEGKKVGIFFDSPHGRCECFTKKL